MTPFGEMVRRRVWIQNIETGAKKCPLAPTSSTLAKMRGDELYRKELPEVKEPNEAVAGNRFCPSLRPVGDAEHAPPVREW